ncbi:MAG: hypothetical protein M1816_007591 [Peltula sp. TS41687]|nr:MAG: hypothetical protein M1816_007591 [Peltula sp. TS41687]
MWNRRLREMAKSAEIYGCPYCPERKIYHQESRLLDHVHAEHPDRIPASEADMDAFRDDLRAKAREKGGTGAAAFRRKGTPVRLLAPVAPVDQQEPKLEPPNPEPEQTGLGVNKSKRPLSAGAVAFASVSQVREIGDIKRLSLNQTRDSLSTDAPSPDQPADAPLSPLGPRKRLAGADASLLDAPPRRVTPEGETRPHPRRSKARSGGALAAVSPWDPPDPEFHRTSPATGEGSRPWTSSGGHRRLFDPNSDDPIARSHPDPASPGTFSRSGPFNPRDHVLQTKGNVRRQENRGAIKKPPIFLQANRSNRDPAPGASPGKEKEVSSSSVTQRDPHLLSQPETRPISQEKLVHEVKGIYAGLVMVEAKCIEVVSKQVAVAQQAGRPPRLNDEQWQALIGLHRTLLHEHHDFFLASQHPAASPDLKRLAAKYSMPSRMWRHGIHPFLELLRYRLPSSLDHMLAFIYLAYSMMALLYETVPTFEDTWVECLGDLARYRMAIEDDDLRDREVWTGVARFWYRKAADKNPTVGRLYHHLAILARPNALQQLYFYSRSLTCAKPFLSARESILTLFDPILKGKEPAYYRPLPMERNFIRAHGILYTGTHLEILEQSTDAYLGALDQHIGRVTAKFREQGVYIAVANIAGMFEYGSPQSELRLAFDERDWPGKNKEAGQQQDSQAGPSMAAGQSSAPPAARPSATDVSQGTITPAKDERSQQIRDHAAHMTFATLALAVQRIGDMNVMPHLHVSLVFLLSTARISGAMEKIEQYIPWDGIATYLNTLATPDRLDARILHDTFPQPKNPKEKARPLREDFAIAGQIWSEGYFPDDWFTKAMVDDEERDLELPSMVDPRVERVLWLGVRVAQFERWLRFDTESKKFSVGPAMEELPGQRDRRWYEVRTCTPPPSGEEEEEGDDEEDDEEGAIEAEEEDDDEEIQEGDDVGADADVEMSGTGGEIEGTSSFVTAGKGSLSVGGRSMSEQEAEFNKSQRSGGTQQSGDEMFGEKLQRFSNNVVASGGSNEGEHVL